MALEIKPLVKNTNMDILNAIRAEASMDYQRRVPEATKARIQDTLRNLQDNRPLYNEFVDALINKIGLTIGRNMVWQNPLARFKMGMLYNGDTIEEYAMGLVEARTYEHDREALERSIFGTHKAPVKAAFHKRNREDYYEITVNENALFSAFNTPTGVSDFVTRLMSVPATSDQWDEFNLMCSLFAEYERLDGFFKVQVPDVRAITSSADDAKDALRKTRQIAQELTFPNTRYNAGHMPTFAKKDDLILFATPAYQAAVDVEALSAAFNPDKLSTPEIITIPEDQFNIDGAQALLTDSSFFTVADQRIQTEQARNPVKMHTNYFFHHWQIISASPFAPAVLFTTKAGNEIIEIRTPVTAVSEITVSNRDGETVTDVLRGELYNVEADAVTDPAGGDNDGVRFSLEGATAPRTTITQAGVLKVAPTEGATSLTITATSTWIDPQGVHRTGKTSTTSVTVSGEVGKLWDGEDDPAVAAGASVASLEAPSDSEASSDSEAPADDYEKLTVDQLKEVLTSRDLSTDGLKADLVARLREDDSKQTV